MTVAAPPFFVAFADREWPSLQHQNRLLEQRLRDAGVPVELLVVPRQSHRRMAVTLSQDGEALTRELARFVKDQACGGENRQANTSQAGSRR